MTGFLHFLLGLVGLGLGWATLGAPLVALAIRSGRSAPERARVRAVPWAIALAGWTGLVLGLVGFFWGAGIPDENAGAAAVMLFSVGCSLGTPAGGVLSWWFITRKVRGSALPVSDAVPADGERSAVRSQRAAIVLLAVGTTVSLTGMGLSLSLGLISLAMATVLVRPLAAGFAVLHGVAGLLALRGLGHSELAKSRAHSALVINVCGVMLALLIAIAGPGFFDSLMKTAAKGMLR